jgi:uncharacterized protein YuzE
MAKENIEVMYDKEEDILSLFKEGSKSKFSFDLALPNGDVVIDYGFDSKIVGIEFFNASSYFPMLKNVSNVADIKASMSVQYGVNWAQVSYALYFPNAKQPIISFINAPYNKRIILEH